MLVIGCTRTKLTASRNFSPICFVPILSPNNTNLSYGDYVCSCQVNAYTTVLIYYIHRYYTVQSISAILRLLKLTSVSSSINYHR